MRQTFVVLVLAIVLLTCGAASRASDSINQFPSPKAAVNHARSLRSPRTDAVEEERSVNIKKLFDFKKWFGVKVPANDAPPFATETIKAMLKSRKYRRTMYKNWDQYRMDEIPALIGEKVMNRKGVAEILTHYRTKGRDYTKWNTP
ncbi:hypothetical protein F442_14006 [Phytophthora nicotianae P10297]|uniref:RxLR effector protein n=2 Tax=Phytophthora nicotianae TaxID=4792 RepID=W2YUE2_PHYNI|nr:hypothetical protein L917_13506 [Phytophthora nicotianae]ETP38351.1 hypothetical protein F442_14006 [Phytophthora nicotianae P10297]